MLPHLTNYYFKDYQHLKQNLQQYTLILSILYEVKVIIEKTEQTATYKKHSDLQTNPRHKKRPLWWEPIVCC
jgi:hypothetical protein